MVQTLAEGKRGRLEAFDYFRGVCIFFIVYQHVLQAMGVKFFWENESGVIYRAIYLTIYQSTYLFVFISGFLFYYVFYQRGFNYKKFMINKLKNIFSPYFLFAILIASLAIYNRIFVTHKPLTADIIMNILFFGSLWYIPFIMVVFLCSHFYIKYIEVDIKWQILLFVIGFLINVLVGRNDRNPLHSMVVFSSIYFLGIICAQHYSKLLRFPTRVWILLSILYVSSLMFISSGQEFYLCHILTHQKHDLSFQMYDLVPIFKLQLCLLSLWIFDGLKQCNCPKLKHILSVLAKYSFSVFFLHNFVWRMPKSWHILPIDNEYVFFGGGLLVAVLVCTVCIAVAYIIRRRAGDKSRMIIGA